MLKIKPEKTFQFSETLLNPKFYTTNFEEISRLNTFEYTNSIRNVVNELEIDYNKTLFSNNSFFLEKLNSYNNNDLTILLKFLERACIAEFSGFLMYKELAKNLRHYNNELLAKGFNLLARDEARHAGFLRKFFSEFGFSFNLSNLAKTRKYIYFSPKYILYATYLSEKIGYWRYISIYRHLEKNSNFRILKLFRYFEAWCQDENRHSEFLGLILKSQKEIIDVKKNRFILKFFVISVYFTMYLNDVSQKEFYDYLGIDQKLYTRTVIQKTHESLIDSFKIVINIYDLKFFNTLETIVKNYLQLQKLVNKKGYIVYISNLDLIKNLIINFVRLFTI